MGRARHLAALVILNSTLLSVAMPQTSKVCSKNGVLYPSESIIP
jgi:hypothetical protein